MTRLRLRRRFVRPWYVPIPGDPGEEDDMAFFFDGVTYTPGTLTAGSGARDVVIELTLSAAAITSGTAAFDLMNLSDANFDPSTYPLDSIKVGSITGGTYNAMTDASGDYQFFLQLFIPAATGHVTATLGYTNAGASPVTVYPCVFLPSGGVDISAGIEIPATTEG